MRICEVFPSIVFLKSSIVFCDDSCCISKLKFKCFLKSLQLCMAHKPIFLALSAHARDGYSSRPVCLSVCQALILEITDN